METKNTLGIRKWESRIYWDFISSNEFATLLTPEQNSIFKYTTMGPMIPKEMKYNLHYQAFSEKIPTLTEMNFLLCGANYFPL